MKKHSVTTRILCLILLTCSLSLVGCYDDTKFSGSSTGNDNQFLLDFKVLNITESNEMPLQAGDDIATEIEITKGKVDIVVKYENGTVVYQGNDVPSGSFTISITDPGTYTFDVTGHKAKGSVHFVKATQKQA